jgi:hypothetical protein
MFLLLWTEFYLSWYYQEFYPETGACMQADMIGYIASLLVVASIIPYATRVVQRKIAPNLVTWALWSLTSYTLLIIYIGIGDVENVWPFVFGFTNPLLITILALYFGSRKLPELEEIKYIIVSVILIAWLHLMHKEGSHIEYILYVAIAANIFAAVPTIKFVIKNPTMDKPLSWTLFGIGHGLALFAINDHSIMSCIFSVYLLLMASIITAILLNHRIQYRIPIREWA